MFNPRPMQAEVLKYRSGKMGVSAVPGSGKTHTLSYLASELIINSDLRDDQEILIVTLVNSAVNNFSTRISGFIKEKGLMPNIGYRVRTLHGLAHDIVRERPELAGLSEHFTIIDEAEASRMLEQITGAYLRVHPEIEEIYVSPEQYPLDSRTRIQWNDAITSINTNFISQAKDWQMDPEMILDRINEAKIVDPLLSMTADAYTQYQRGLRTRNAVDFSDLIRLAYRVIQNDGDYLAQLQYRWPYILEDEAQDSSQLQELILRTLSGTEGNWVRVGDPNQAIYESFTTASPKFLKNFLVEPGVIRRDLANSGRSSRSILHLANELINWSMTEHPVFKLRDSLTTPLILPTDPGDPQPNPPDVPNSIYIFKSPMNSDQEINKVVDSINKWLPANMDKTVAVLTPIAAHGDKVIEALQASDIKVVEMLKSSESTRTICRIIEKALFSLADPSSSVKLASCFLEIFRFKDASTENKPFLESIQNALKTCPRLEDYFYPQPQSDWLTTQIESSMGENAAVLLRQFRELMIRWHQASVLPIDQLIITISQDLFSAPEELALTHKIALLQEFNARVHPEFQLIDFARDLEEIAGNRRKFLGFSEEEGGFDPEDHKGEVVVSTYHKAKGLEWDRVYLLSVNNYDFPSAQEFDQYKSEKWFFKGGLNLEAEVLAKLKALSKNQFNDLYIDEGAATRESRLSYASERLRLLFVGITRARENLIITWNTGKQQKSKMALSLSALAAILEEMNETAK